MEQENAATWSLSVYVFGESQGWADRKRWQMVIFSKDKEQRYVSVSQKLLFTASFELGRWLSEMPGEEPAVFYKYLENECLWGFITSCSSWWGAYGKQLDFVRLHFPSESTLSHALEKPLPPLMTQGTYWDETQPTQVRSNFGCQRLGREWIVPAVTLHFLEEFD